MLVYFAALLTYALLNFGAVLPQSWLLILTLWFVGFAVLIIQRVFKNASVTTELVALAVGGAFVLLAGPKIGAAILAGCWAWAGATRGTDRVMRFLNILIVIGVLEALLGLVQFFVSPGWIFGYITSNTSNRSSGTLINRNHFAGLLGLLIPACFGCALVGLRRYGDFARSYVYILAGAFMATALIFSLSRSGIISFVITLAVLSGIVKVKGASGRFASVLGLGLLTLVVAGAVWIGIDVIVEQYAVLLEEDYVVREGRMTVFRETLNMIAANPLGVGIGKYRDSFRQFQTFRPDLLFDHAHNDYLETAAEFGVPVAILVWGGVFFALYRMAAAFLTTRSPAQGGILLACIGSVTSIVLHSLTDFNLQIPSNAMLFFAFLGIGLSMCRQPSQVIYEPD